MVYQSADVCEFLDRMFPQRWIRCDRPSRLPPWSPDIIPLDFFLWSFVKRVYMLHLYLTVMRINCIWHHFHHPRHTSANKEWVRVLLDITRAMRGAHIQMHWFVLGKTFWIALHDTANPKLLCLLVFLELKFEIREVLCAHLIYYKASLRKICNISIIGWLNKM